jgi:hypothetical protein
MIFQAPEAVVRNRSSMKADYSRLDFLVLDIVAKGAQSLDRHWQERLSHRSSPDDLRQKMNRR